MKIAIVGAGIAGLAAAAACVRHPRVEVTDFEQAERFDPVAPGSSSGPMRFAR